MSSRLVACDVLFEMSDPLFEALLAVLHVRAGRRTGQCADMIDARLTLPNGEPTCDVAVAQLRGS
jgi:hypothetical protein